MKLPPASVPLFLLAFACSAGAQEAPSSTPSAPRTEIGGHVAGLFLQKFVPGVGFRAGRRLGRRFSLELEVDKMGAGRDAPYADEVRWIYLIKGSHRLGTFDRGRASVFLSYGTAGWAERTQKPGEVVRQPDGTLAQKPARWGTAVVIPVLPMLGVAGQRTLTPYLAARIEAQVLFGIGGDLRPVSGRATAGVAVPIGRYPR